MILLSNYNCNICNWYFVVKIGLRTPAMPQGASLFPNCWGKDIMRCCCCCCCCCWKKRSWEKSLTSPFDTLLTMSFSVSFHLQRASQPPKHMFLKIPNFPSETLLKMTCFRFCPQLCYTLQLASQPPKHTMPLWRLRNSNTPPIILCPKLSSSLSYQLFPYALPLAESESADSTSVYNCPTSPVIVLDRFGQDIGTGSGFLAMLAAKYGAKKVLSAVLARAMVAREAFQSS